MNNYIAFGILITLAEHKKCSCSYLAEKFEVSKKTIYRYVTELSASGIPIYCSQGKNGGIELLKDYDLESNFFTTDEIARINSLLSSCEIAGVDKTTKSVIEKINHTLNRKMLKGGLTNVCDQILIDNLPWGVDQLYNEKILNLIDACNQNKILTISYTSRNNLSSIRTIHPYSLVLKDGIWYLYAFCTTKQDFRLFKCSRIQEIKNTNSIFSRIPKNLEEKPWRISSSAFGEEINLIMQVSTNLIPDLHDWLASYTIHEQTPNFSVIETKVINNDGLISRLLNFGNKIKVISPQSVQQNLLTTCQNISTLYAS